MKAWITGGLCLALGLSASHSIAQEINFRPVAGTPVPASQAPSGIGISLSRPIPIAPIVRGQSETEEIKPLPVGPTLLKGDNGKQNAKQEPKVNNKDVEGIAKPKPKPMPLQKDFVPQMPAVAHHGPTPMESTSGDCGDTACCNTACCDTGHGCYLGMGLCRLVRGILGHDCCSISDACGVNECGYAGDCFDECCPERPHLWVSGEYLLWRFKQRQIPPLVTASPGGTPLDQSGVLGLPNTTVLYDDENQESAWHSGGRFNFGFFFRRRPSLGLEVGYMSLSERESGSIFGSGGNPQISRPLVNALTGAEGAQLVSFPGLVSGSVRVDTRAELWGVELNLREKLCCNPCGWLDFIIGYRFLSLEEGITIRENLNRLDAPFVGINQTVTDDFQTRNVFDGAQVGLIGERRINHRWFVGASAKVAVGNVRQTVDITGSQTITLPGAAPVSVNGGILALPTNIGSHTQNRFCVVPEVGIKIGFDINENWRIWAGYDFLYMSSVVRPGDQIDRTINPTQVPDPLAGPGVLAGPARPAVLFRTSDFWAQGASFGLEYRY